MGRLWIIWTLLTASLGFGLVRQLPTRESASSSSTMFLPGETTHGHHQIEMKCGVCHEPGGTVREQSCLDCHEADLKAARDTHPRTKFIDPTKAVLLERVDATNCLTCHTEHVAERTHGAGITLPRDYCIHCHDTVADDRPSHTGLAFDTCLNAGCHNFHDNGALNENFLRSHYREPDVLDVPSRLLPPSTPVDAERSLSEAKHDAPAEYADAAAIDEWASSAHAAAGVNCSACHVPTEEGATGEWTNEVGLASCRRCHEFETKGFLSGLHGTRLDVGLTPMQPSLARLPMKHDALHRDLDCNACHVAHRDDTRYAAVDACLLCHDDEHSRAYVGTRHHELWKAELAGEAAAGSGVSCASCHMPRLATKKGPRVQHDQSANLEPNTKMVRTACANCHGLAFTLNALADPHLAETCYGTAPGVDVESLEMVRKWFESRGRPIRKKTD